MVNSQGRYPPLDWEPGPTHRSQAPARLTKLRPSRADPSLCSALPGAKCPWLLTFAPPGHEQGLIRSESREVNYHPFLTRPRHLVSGQDSRCGFGRSLAT